MELLNETLCDAAWFLGFQPDGRELLVIAVKAAYASPADGGEPLLADTQVPLTKADEFTGEPGVSATLYESDYAHRKPACDVLVNGSAHAPNGKPTEKTAVGLHVGPIHKRFEVVGDRVWDGSRLGTAHSAPKPFLKLPITYDRAYGGTDRAGNRGEEVHTYADNPVGAGFYPLSRGMDLAGKPLANTQEIGQPATDRVGKCRPMSFGPVGRNFKCRVPYAGTYDKRWTEERAPYFPADFDYRYFQSAPEDQWIPYPAGGEEIVLENLTPAGLLRFNLPRQEMPILFVPHGGEAIERPAVVDTVLIEPDRGRLLLTWRASLPLRRSCFDVKQVVIGKTATQHIKETRQARKMHYGSLDEMIQARRGRRG